MVTESPTDVYMLPATLQLVTHSETVADLCCPDGLLAWNKALNSSAETIFFVSIQNVQP